MRHWYETQMSVKSSVWRIPRQHATALNLATGCYGWSLIISRPASSPLLLLTWPYFNLYIQIVFLSFYSNTTGVKCEVGSNNPSGTHEFIPGC